eukprot:PhF_6_TR28101/c0_g1_i2/m.41545/K08991/MUS81; crossover junction endonuclease MUS81
MVNERLQAAVEKMIHRITTQSSSRDGAPHQNVFKHPIYGDVSLDTLQQAQRGLSRYPIQITEKQELEDIHGVDNTLCQILIHIVESHGKAERSLSSPQQPQQQIQEQRPKVRAAHYIGTGGSGAVPYVDNEDSQLMPLPKKRTRSNTTSSTTVPTATTTTLSEEVVWIVVDTRERTKGKQLSELLKGSRSLGGRVKDAVLPVGDVVWVGVDVLTGAERVLPVVVERKKVSDLAASIIDGRMADQRSRLASCGVPHVVYIIEGNMKASYQLSEEALRSSLHSVVLREGFHIIYTPNTAGTLRVLTHITKNILSMSSDVVIQRTEVLPRRVRSIQNTPFVPFHGDLKAWTDHVQTMEEIFVKEECFHRMLCHIPNVGNEMAFRVAQQYPSALSLRRTL